MRELITVVVIGCSFVVPISAQSDWSAVTTLSPGTRVRIESARGGDAKGLLQAVDEAQLSLQGKPPAARADIRKVERLGDRQAGKFAKRGFLIGVVAGTVITAITTTKATPGTRVVWSLWQGGSWGMLGAAIGAIDGVQSRERTIIYTAP